MTTLLVMVGRRLAAVVVAAAGILLARTELCLQSTVVGVGVHMIVDMGMMTVCQWGDRLWLLMMTVLHTIVDTTALLLDVQVVVLVWARQLTATGLPWTRSRRSVEADRAMLTTEGVLLLGGMMTAVVLLPGDMPTGVLPRGVLPSLAMPTTGGRHQVAAAGVLRLFETVMTTGGLHHRDTRIGAHRLIGIVDDRVCDGRSV